MNTAQSSANNAKGQRLVELHNAPELLQVINVWDVISAKVIADLPGTKALATASHSIAASLGYEDGENIPRELMIEAVGRIAASTELPVSADLEAGYGDAGETVRQAIGVGIVGANLEDQLKPFDEAVAAVRAAVKAASDEGVTFALNARTDVFVKGGPDADKNEQIAEAVKRGKAFLDEGATNVFVPGLFDETTVSALVEGLGRNKLSVIGIPGSLAPAKLSELGVSRISYGPLTQRLALTALQAAAENLLAGGVLPEGIKPLN
ncbi:isocitrate lyase/phosphoenolpyruvate mutase family protein [Psychromicrobium sp. YIM B11713]|uniref:isocitrate lyase/PEP mutase family protein n=1 Tax=Psychromicrobium sp. YIM B11713 TaxID=3145233 RepID=UPI00374F7E09